VSFKLVYHPHYTAALPSGHRFPMTKFRRLYELLLESRLVEAVNVHEPVPAKRAWLELAHTAQYVEGVCSQSLDENTIRRIGLPMDEKVVRRSLAAVGGTVLASRLALDHGIACQQRAAQAGVHIVMEKPITRDKLECILNKLSHTDTIDQPDA